MVPGVEKSCRLARCSGQLDSLRFDWGMGNLEGLPWASLGTALRRMSRDLGTVCWLGRFLLIKSIVLN